MVLRTYTYTCSVQSSNHTTRLFLLPDPKSPLNMLHDNNDIKPSNEQEHLEQTGLVHVHQTGEISDNVAVSGATQVKVSGQKDSTGRGQVSGNSQHGNTAMLQFHVPQTIKFVLIAVGHQAQGIKEAQGSLSVVEGEYLSFKTCAIPYVAIYLLRTKGPGPKC